MIGWLMMSSTKRKKKGTGYVRFHAFKYCTKATLQHSASSLTSQFSAKLHNACGHDIKRHVTCIYKVLEEKQDDDDDDTGNKITNYLRPYLCFTEYCRKNLYSISLFMTLLHSVEP
ncbi:CLUMA_CG001857, isoform A [Clunio marinus]|uniref:CLUMA_CG001857, isoform A n=1 Tax=Clunio marinus TaxID=568069 RepID=A0A1J1HJ43_9DIPT|nr:CLUMA_CG001857, isoform A [Clunio marinus]